MTRSALPILVLSLVIALTGCTSKRSVQKEGGESLPSVNPSGNPLTGADDAKTKAAIDALCSRMNASIVKYKWNLKTCDGISWHSDRVSEEGQPLIYAEFGEPTSTNKTLIFAMVHPDEITPLYLSFKLAQYFREHELEFRGTHVILAPLVNPDGFFHRPLTRVNARGVDVNRNFDTPLWRSKALTEWKTALMKNPRRFPGNEPCSEAETKFQVDLIERFRPTKILSIHAPLNVMDYDGPTSLTLDRFAKEYVHECYLLRNQIKAKSTGYFPGSLGNYSGVERGIPTITLELPSANPNLADEYWKKFQPGIHSMVTFKFDKVDSIVVRSPEKK